MEKRRKLKKKKLGTFQATTVAVSTFLSLILVGVGIIAFLTFKVHSKYKRENMPVNLYLSAELKPHQITKFKKNIESKPYILKKNGVPQVEHFSGNQWYKDFIKESKKRGENVEVMDDFDPMLPDHLVLSIAPAYQKNNKLTQIKRNLESLSEATLFDWNRNDEYELSRFNSNLRYLNIILGSLGVISLLTVIMLISNTIKLALFSQRFLIRSMQLVGAKSNFIKWPFQKRAFLIGLICGIGAATLLIFTFEYVKTQVDYAFLPLLEKARAQYIAASLVFLLGILISYLSTNRALNKYLKMSLNELY